MSKQDTIVSAVIENFIRRSDAGIKKYGTNLDRDDLEVSDWLNHLQEELMDATLYIEKLKSLSVEDIKIFTVDSWLEADKRVVDGFLYVKISDLKSLPF